jgi:hypothetical protein
MISKVFYLLKVEEIKETGEAAGTGRTRVRPGNIFTCKVKPAFLLPLLSKYICNPVHIQIFEGHVDDLPIGRVSS